MDLNDLRDIHDSKGPKPEIAKYRPISADSHVSEPPAMYEKYMSAQFRDRAPKIAQGKHGDEMVLEGVPVKIPFGTLSSAGRDPKDILFKNNKVADLDPGGWDPVERLKAQDADGIHAEIIYPTVGMIVSQMPDYELQNEMILAYNRWLSEFCAHSPKRLIGAGQTACLSPEQTIKDIHLIKSQGFKGIYMSGYSPWATDYDHADWDKVWAICADLEMPICFHVFGGKRPGQQANFDDGRGPAIGGWHRILRDNQDLIGMFIFGGVFERHPKLKMVSVESDAGWVPHFTYRMDHMYARHRFWQKAPPLALMPSEYFYENIWVTFQDDLVAFQIADLMKTERLMWANDFPHADSTWPWSHSLLLEQTKTLGEYQKQRILHQNVVDLFKLDID